MASEYSVPTNFSQALQRRYLRAVDQHGRRWGVNLEIKSNAPTGPWESYFWVPSKKLIPSGQYLKRSEDRPNRVWIDYDQMIKDMREAQKDWDRELDRQMRKRYREGAVNKEPDKDILMMIGQRPGPVEIWVACRQGNRYALGLTDVPDERVVKFLPQVQEEQYEDELDFRDETGADPWQDEIAKQEREDATAFQGAWGAKGRQGAAKAEDFDDIFDTEALGGKTESHRTAKPRGRPKKKAATATAEGDS